MTKDESTNVDREHSMKDFVFAIKEVALFLEYHKKLK